MDIWDPKKRSAVMARIKSKDTKPELIVRHYLYHRGYRYRKNVKELPGTPDIVLYKYKIVIFVHGCFWHGHEIDSHIPHSNKSFWEKKIKQNKIRDQRNKIKLKELGWHVMTIWECQLKPAVREQTLLGIEYYINHLFLEKFKTPLPTQENFSSLVAEEAETYTTNSQKE
ncbi:very short patch repair endonuclease [Bacteroides mediterraneensis]|uniref:DNA mismatch endonuclease Vsr n=1 Tax=Bacteroides mediterraneensis TaxID=1841856 RepID=A0ABS2EUN8_9BACE|nr:very short patch repair endonuclease [Bacteroides mediterraneensis]MBM6758089.1 DNA mismatch endonuclease Vsr [Bacteroides mediterraneensis]